MQLLVEQIGDVHVVRVREAKLTYPVLSSFLAEVREIVECGAKKLVLDLEAVTYVDSSSIGCLVEIHRLLRDRGGSLKLSGLRPRVETMLSMTGVHKIVDFHPDEAEALAAFGEPPKRNGDAPRQLAGAASAARTMPGPTRAKMRESS